MQTITNEIFLEDAYLGVTLGALVYPHGTIYLDAPLRPEDARTWRSALVNQYNGSNRLLISLDSHIDRTLGTKALDCAILAQQKAAMVFRNRPTIFKGQGSDNGSEWESYLDSVGTRWAIPDITFTQHITLHWGGPEILVEHHPGPAFGASWVIIPEEKVLFVGDAVVINQPPFLANADLVAWIETLELLYKEYKDFQIISGRGGLTPITAVKEQLVWLKDLSKRLDRLAKKNAAPEATGKLVTPLLEHLAFPKDRIEHFHKRLQTGLYQYYLRHFRPGIDLEGEMMEEEESPLSLKY